MSVDQPSFRPHLAALRGLAILLVLLYHVKVGWCRCGFFGVDVFFVLSGYLMAVSLLIVVSDFAIPNASAHQCTLSLRSRTALQGKHLCPTLRQQAPLPPLEFPAHPNRILRTA